MVSLFCTVRDQLVSFSRISSVMSAPAAAICACHRWWSEISRVMRRRRQLKLKYADAQRWRHFESMYSRRRNAPTKGGQHNMGLNCVHIGWSTGSGKWLQAPVISILFADNTAACVAVCARPIPRCVPCNFADHDAYGTYVLAVPRCSDPCLRRIFVE